MRMKILVVDDDEFIHEVVEIYLFGMGHQTLHAYSSAEAQGIAAEAKNIDLLITDIVMPGDDGTKLIRDLHKTRPDLPVLAITGGVENAKDEYVQLAEFFADFTVTKPLTKTALIGGIRQATEAAQKRINPVGTEQPLDGLQRLLLAYDL